MQSTPSTTPLFPAPSQRKSAWKNDYSQAKARPNALSEALFLMVRCRGPHPLSLHSETHSVPSLLQLEFYHPCLGLPFPSLCTSRDPAPISKLSWSAIASSPQQRGATYQFSGPMENVTQTLPSSSCSHKWRQKVGIEKDSYLTMEKWQVLERGHIYFDRTSHTESIPIRMDNFYVSVRNKRRTTVGREKKFLLSAGRKSSNEAGPGPLSSPRSTCLPPHHPSVFQPGLRSESKLTPVCQLLPGVV